MKGKNIILVGTGAVMGFVSCGYIVAKKVLTSKRMMTAIKNVITDWVLEKLDDSKEENTSHRPRVSYRYVPNRVRRRNEN